METKINQAVNIVSRGEIPTLNQIEIDGEIHNLGVLKEFRKHQLLSSFIPDQARLSMSWVGLKPNEVLNPHEHPTSSMIIVCEGSGQIIGDCNQPLKAGDIAAIPPNNKHGFIGGGENGFWGLSIQFEGLGLYENREAPRVKFVDPNDTKKVADFESLMRHQHHCENAYKRSALLRLVRVRVLQTDHINDPAVQERLLEVLNLWGNWFQRILFARAAIGGNAHFQDIAEEHIREEVGHNTNLLKARGNKPIKIWDPILEATASWFHDKMLSASDAERTILIHFVLEASGEIFHKEAAKIFPDIEHFRHHGEVDDDHFEMGCRLLRQTSGLDFNDLRDTLQQGWSMMIIMCDRMAAVAKKGMENKI